jgi:hypothetical protein
MLRVVNRLNAVASVTAAPGIVMPAVAGAYARVSGGGVLRCGDSVQVKGHS